MVKIAFLFKPDFFQINFLSRNLCKAEVSGKQIELGE